MCQPSQGYTLKLYNKAKCKSILPYIPEANFFIEMTTYDSSSKTFQKTFPNQTLSRIFEVCM